MTNFSLDQFDEYRQKTLDADSKVAVFDHMIRTLYMNQQNHKQFTYKILDDYWFINNIVIYFRKNFYLATEFDEIISRLTASGLVNHWFSQYIAKSMKGQSKSGPSSLKLLQLKGIFEVLVYGLVFSLACFTLEILLFKFRFRK